MKNDTLIQPYLIFDGKCEEAIEFYKRALGAKVQMLMRVKDSPEPPPADCPPMDGNRIMHAEIQVGQTVVMCSDGRDTGIPKFDGFTLSLTLSDEADAKPAFNALAEGGRVEMPLTRTFYSPSFGMVVDRFGVMWMVYAKPSGDMPSPHKK